MLVSLANMKSYLGIADTSQDTYLTGELNLFTEAIQNYCNRKFEVDEYIETIYRQDFGGAIEHYLYHYPVTSIESATEKEDDVEYDLTTRIHKPTGKVNVVNDGYKTKLFTNTGHAGYIEFIYEAGYATIPLEIQEAVKALIQARYNRKIAGIELNFGSNVQRLNIPGVMGIDFDYTLTSNERTTRYGALLGDYLNIFDAYRSERVLLGSSSLVQVEENP